MFCESRHSGINYVTETLHLFRISPFLIFSLLRRVSVGHYVSSEFASTKLRLCWAPLRVFLLSITSPFGPILTPLYLCFLGPYFDKFFSSVCCTILHPVFYNSLIKFSLS